MNTSARLIPALLLALATSAFAGSADDVGVVDPYVRLMPPGAAATAAFMTLKNAGDKDARLVKAESGAAKKVELHTHVADGEIMRMRQVDAIDIKAKGEAALKPGGYHIMLIQPVGAMKEGDKVAITLGFADGSSKKVEAAVRRPESAAPTMDHSKHGHHH